MQIIEINSLSQAQTEIQAIGCDIAGTQIMSRKALTRAIKLKNISSPAALILKQEMLALGGDAVNARGVISGKLESSDVLLLGTLATFQKLVTKLQNQQFRLPKLGQDISEALSRYQQVPQALTLSSRKRLTLTKAVIMGILNCTPDSFSDGGQFKDLAQAVSHAEQMIKAGAGIIDIGGESSRPGAVPVLAEEELFRVIPVIEKIAAKTIVSIDTTKAEVARVALQAGAQIVNDISALRSDSKMAEVVAEAGCPVVLMHMQGSPQNMQERPEYDDIMYELCAFFEERIASAIKSGIAEENIIIDPGIGFGKFTQHNLIILNKLEQLQIFGRPILLGTSRKSVIGNVLNVPTQGRLLGTAATVCFGVFKNAKIIRVHDVEAMSQVVKMTEAMLMRDGDSEPLTSF